MTAGDLVSVVSGETKPNSTTPRTDGLIARAMARHPGQSARAQADYYEDVHQDLAPLARQMEAEIIDLVKALQMAKHIVAAEGTTEQLNQVFAALELAGIQP